MARSYKKKTNRSKRKLIQSNKQAVTVSLADGQARFQMVLPMSEALFDMAGAVEQTTTQAGLPRGLCRSEGGDGKAPRSIRRRAMRAAAEPVGGVCSSASDAAGGGEQDPSAGLVPGL